MDASTLLLIVVIIFAILIALTFVLYRKNASAKIQAGSLSMEVSGSNEPAKAKGAATPAAASPDINVTDAKTSAGGLYVDDQGGGRVNVQRVETKDDIIVTRRSGDATPKP